MFWVFARKYLAVLMLRYVILPAGRRLWSAAGRRWAVSGGRWPGGRPASQGAGRSASRNRGAAYGVAFLLLAVPVTGLGCEKQIREARADELRVDVSLAGVPAILALHA